ncbi:SusC/RagA family TonB-linked outer membrane protein [Chitinophaga sp. CF418]|uniref:SusC/RagA family TonB-linked outer membrane protein n=1 Tax=Chitinophaga sp. CF418 TaxID=1855287 RepID=UPI0016600503|nr:SusC/RagA family TonB-linked outer membrane protein [Chitinophaga sp. CF418]
MSQTVSFSGRNMSIKEAFAAIKKQTGYAVFAQANLITSARPVTVDAHDMPLTAFIDLLLKDQQITYRIVNKSIILSGTTATGIPAESEPDKQEQAMFLLNGQIIDARGLPLDGATIRVPDTQRSTRSGAHGTFTLPVMVGEILRVSFVGYEIRDIKITAIMKTSANFELKIGMKLANTTLTGATIVSNGYQQLNKERAAGSFAKPDMQVFTKRTGTLDVMNRLEGLVAGLSVTPGPNGLMSSGNFGARGTTQMATIRGKGSVGLSTNPLYVLNGLPVEDVSALNPDDIADITVLKDAVAASIWGARAANGVIVINTKTGTRNAPVTVRYSGFINVTGKPDFSYGKWLSSRDYIQQARELFDPVQFPYQTLSYGVIAPHEQIMYDQYRGVISADEANRKLDSLSGINNIGQIKDLWYRNAATSNHTVSISAGTPNYSFYGSLSYANILTNRPDDKNRTYRVTLNQDFNINRNLKVSMKGAFAENVSRSYNNAAVRDQFLPYQLFKDAQGNVLNLNYLQGWSDVIRTDYQTRSRINLDYNPLAERLAGYDDRTTRTFNLTGDVSLKIWKGISFLGTYGYQVAPGMSKGYQDFNVYNVRRQALNFTVAPTASSTPIYYLPVTGGTYVLQNNDLRAWTSRNQLVYTGTLRHGADRINIQLGQEAREELASTNTTKIFGYNPELLSGELVDYQTLFRGLFNTVASGRSVLSEIPYFEVEQRSRFSSLFMLLNYTFNDKYSVDGSLRRDQSNAIGSDKSTQNRPTWSIGFRWDIGKEPFMKNLTWIDKAGIRATYGITGNAPPAGGASFYDILVRESGNLSSAGAGVSINSPANRKLSWESTKNTNIGIDLTVLKSRLTATMDVYWRSTTDLTGLISLNPFSGFRTTTGNIGNLRNRGIELSVQSVNVRAGRWEWSTSLTFSYNKNKLVSYTTALSYLSNTADAKAAAADYFVGYSMNPLFAYRYAGLDNAGDPQIYLKNGAVSKSPTAATVDDIVYKGTQIPVFNGGMTNNIRYQNYALSINMIYNMGHVMRKDINTVYNSRITANQGSFLGNLNAYFPDRWKQPGDERITDIPRYIAGESPLLSNRKLEYYTLADRNIVSASYIKIRDITFSYDLQNKLLQKAGISAVNLYVQATNFMVWKANDFDIDPEYHVLYNGTRELPPFKHGYSFGANITF